MSLVVNLINHAQAAQVFKYKDEKGQWVYSDKPPKTELTFEQLSYQSEVKKTLKPKLFVTKKTNEHLLMAKNPFFAPVEIAFTSPISGKKERSLLPARSTVQLLSHHARIGNVKYRWLLGDSSAEPDNFSYHSPAPSKFGHLITQAFNGRFSHQGEQNQYAVDIALDVGTDIKAVRSGTVFWVKDDYHMGGRTDYFLDKANVIKVLHEDGTFAIYAHILMDTAVVKPGDEVVVGQTLARSGSSGYSTGPHLHFAIQKNTDFKITSIPFKFIDQQSGVFTPKARMKIFAE